MKDIEARIRAWNAAMPIAECDCGADGEPCMTDCICACHAAGHFEVTPSFQPPAMPPDSKTQVIENIGDL